MHTSSRADDKETCSDIRDRELAEATDCNSYIQASMIVLNIAPSEPRCLCSAGEVSRRKDRPKKALPPPGTPLRVNDNNPSRRGGQANGISGGPDSYYSNDDGKGSGNLGDNDTTSIRKQKQPVIIV